MTWVLGLMIFNAVLLRIIAVAAHGKSLDLKMSKALMDEKRHPFGWSRFMVKCMHKTDLYISCSYQMTRSQGFLFVVCRTFFLPWKWVLTDRQKWLAGIRAKRPYMPDRLEKVHYYRKRGHRQLRMISTYSMAMAIQQLSLIRM